MSKQSVYVGEYQMLDTIPNIEMTGDGIRVNFYEPKSKNYYTKVFQNQDRQVYNAKEFGLHKICFEGTTNLFVATQVVRVSVKMHDEAKHDKKLAKALKSSDLKESKNAMLNLQTNLVSLAQSIKDGEGKINKFDKLQGEYDGRTVWLSIFTILIVSATSALEAYFFKKSMSNNSYSKVQ